MSFILEAQKRDAANVDPAVAAQLAVDAHHASRWRWIWLGIGTLVLVNALIIGYFFNPFASDGQSGSSDPALSTPNGARDLVVRPRERTGPNRAPVGNTSDARRPAPARTPTATAARRPAPASPTAAPANSGRGRVLTPEQAAAMNIDLPDRPAEATVATPSFETTAQAQQPQAAVAPKTAPTAAAPEAAPADEAITLADLSPADRAAFPKLEFSTHIFADDPALRAVVVNSKRLAEGESIGEMVLRAVTEDGILVDYRGQRVAVSVVETWN